MSIRLMRIHNLIIINLLFVIVLYAAKTLFSLFAYGAYPIFAAPVIASLSGLLVLVGVPTAVFLLVLDIGTASKKWKQYKMKSLIPLLILIMGLFIPPIINGTELAEKRFLNKINDYQAFVNKLESVEPNTHQKVLHDTEEYRDLAYMVRAYEDDPNELVVEFVVGGMGPPPKHTAFLYTSDGDIKKNSKAGDRWYSRKRLTDNWFMVHD